MVLKTKQIKHKTTHKCGHIRAKFYEVIHNSRKINIKWRTNVLKYYSFSSEIIMLETSIDNIIHTTVKER
jgi:hypothetical protein